MRILFALIVAVIGLLNSAARKKKEGDGRQAAKTPHRAAATGVPIGQVGRQRRTQAKNSAQWRAAKEKQDDAEQVHSVHMDSCEGKLESLKTLYEAGILDREEYAERVARTRAQHAHGTQER